MKKYFLMIALLALTLVSCGDKHGSGKGNYLMLDQFVLVLEAGDNAKLNATTYSNVGRSDFAYGWSSTNPAVATVDGQGNVKALSAGAADIVAQAENGASAACRVMVLQFVDLGGAVLWATCNFGASRPQDAGFYYAWGEKGNKNTYTWTNYAFATAANQLKKYNWDEHYGEVDGKSVLDASDDIVSYTSDRRFRMPSRSDLETLLTDASVGKEYVNEEGRRGLKVWSESTGAEIFLPVTGYFEASVLESQTMGYYWTSALAGTDSEPSKAIALSFDTGGAVKDAILRFRGLLIRPVKAKP